MVYSDGSHQIYVIKSQISVSYCEQLYVETVLVTVFHVQASGHMD